MNEKVISGCTGKAAYVTRGEATMVLHRMVRRKINHHGWCRAAKLKTYKCRACGHWHLGTDAKGGKSREGRDFARR